MLVRGFSCNVPSRTPTRSPSAANTLPMTPRHVYQLLFLLLTVAVASSAQPLLCNDPKQPAYVFISSSQYSYFQGATLKVFAAYIPPPPLPPVLSPYVEASLGFEILSILEVEANSSSNGVRNCTILHTIEEANALLIRNFSLADAYCEGQSSTETSFEGIEQEVYNVTITHPDFPGMTVNLVASLAKATFTEIVPATPETLNLDLNLTHSSHAPKLELYINHWPWQRPLGASYLSFFTSFSIFSPVDTTMEFVGLESSPWLSLTSNAGFVELKADLLNAFEIDGTWHAQPTAWLANFTIPANETIAIVSSSNICTANENTLPSRFQRAFFDPTLLALWTGPLSPTSTSPASNGKLAPGSIAAIVVVLSCLAILGVVAAVWRWKCYKPPGSAQMIEMS